MKPSSISRLLFLGVSILTLAFSVSAHAGGLKNLTVGHDTWVGYSGYYIALEKKLFEKNGLEIEDKVFSNPGDTMPALIGGHLDLALSTLQNISYAKLSSGTDIKLIYMFDTSNGADAIVAKKEIKSVKDLKGKTVAATLGEVNHMLLITALKENGMSESDIKFVNMNADDAGGAFVSGNVDAAVTWEPWVTKAKQSGGHVVFDSSMVPDTILDAVSANSTTIQAKSTEVTSFLKAIDEGVTFLYKNPDEGAAIVAKALEVTKDDVLAMLKTDKIYTLTDNRRLMNGPIKESLKRVDFFLLSQHMVKSADSAEQIIDTSFIK